MRTSDPDQRHDISSLTNLRSFRIWTDDNNEDMEESLVIIRRYLSQLRKHSPLLEGISIVVCYENDASIEALSVLDNILGGKGFENLRLLQFEIHFPPYYELEDEDEDVDSIDTVYGKLKKKFPLVQKRAIVETIEPILLYPWYGTGGSDL